MRILIAEDDFTSRRILQKLLSPYGMCDIAVNGKEAVDAFRLAWAEEAPYELVCLDIMMPCLDGSQVLADIRSFEKERGIEGLKGTKIIMTTALDDFTNIMTAFRGQCDSYLVKPIVKAKLIGTLERLDLL